MRIKSFFLLSVLCVFLSIAQNKSLFSKDENIIFLKGFYVEYMKGSLKKKEYMSEELIKKLERMQVMIGLDPIIYAQDIVPEMIKSLSVSHIRKQWYKVTYQTSFNRKEGFTNIFVKIKDSEIVSIYPWMINIDDIDQTFIPNKISNEDNLSFVRTFYENYISYYINNSKGLHQDLKVMQNKYCSSSLLKKKQDIQNEYSLNGEEGFDPLIGNFDFDKSFLKSLKFNKIDDGKVLFEYDGAFQKEIRLYIHTKKDGNSYLIDDVTE